MIASPNTSRVDLAHVQQQEVLGPKQVALEDA